MQQSRNHTVWGIVLAGGEGTRVREFLTRLCDGRGIKQFCAVVGRRSMLEHTLARVEQLIPRERTLVVVSPDHQAEVASQLATWPQENVIWQPRDRDTAAGILLPLAHISHRDLSGTVAIFPSDHFIIDEARFMGCVQKAVKETENFPHALTLLGIASDHIEDGYGWIEAAEAEPGRETLAIQRFWEKPSPLQVYTLLRRGALVNTFVAVARATALWAMALQATPDLYRDFLRIRHALGQPQAEEVTVNTYQTMRAVNFSSDICAPLVSRLRVLQVPEVGWSDWGCEERILSSLQQLGKLDECLARLQQHKGKTPCPSFSQPTAISLRRTVPYLNR